MIAPALALLGAVAGSQVEPGAFAERVHVVFEVTEDLAPDELIALRRLGQVEPRVVTRSNMVPEGLLDAVQRFPSSQVLLRLPLLRAHTEQLDDRPGVGVALDLGAAPLDAVAIGQIQHLGPRHVTIRLSTVDAPRFAALARLGAVEVEDDARGRTLDGGEIGRLLQLYRARRIVHVDSGAHLDAIRGLAVLKPVTVVVDAGDAVLPEPIREALLDLRLPVRVRFERLPTAAQVGRAIKGLRASIELAPTNGAELEPAAVELVRSLGPPPLEP